jgi:hypothetical protein
LGVLGVRGRPCSAPDDFVPCIIGVKSAPPLMMAMTSTVRSTEPGQPFPSSARAERVSPFAHRAVDVDLTVPTYLTARAPQPAHAHGGGKGLPVDCTTPSRFINPQKMSFDVHCSSNGMMMPVELYRPRPFRTLLQCRPMSGVHVRTSRHFPRAC